MCETSDYKTFFEEAPIALCRTNIRTGKFEMANAVCAEILGCSSEEELMEKHKSTDFYPLETRRKLIRKLKKHGIVEDEELQLILPNGGRLWIKANFRLNCDGECIECFLSDITELVELRSRQLESLKMMSEQLDTKIAAIAG